MFEKYFVIIAVVTCITPLLLIHNVQVTAIENAMNTTEGIAEAIESSKIIIETIDNFIQETLMPEARKEGVHILEATKQHLMNCESQLKAIDNIPAYHACTKPELGKAMAALSALQSKYHLLHWQNVASMGTATSGADKMKLFW